MGYVEANNTYQVKSRLRCKLSAERLVATAEERHDNTALHRAVALGFVEMTSMLLEAGASVDELNSMGDAPIHCCWRFWGVDTSKYFVWRKDPYLMTTKQQLKDFARMVRRVHKRSSCGPDERYTNLANNNQLPELYVGVFILPSFFFVRTSSATD